MEKIIVPIIDRYLGIIFTGGEHPPPHIHVRYNEFKASVDLRTGCILAGKLPPRVIKLTRKWLNENREATLKEWERMENGETPRPLESSSKIKLFK